MPYYVYAIQAESTPIKIGIASDLRDRLFHLQTAHFEQLTLLFSIRCPSRDAALRVESALHQKYSDLSIRGEWFEVSAETLARDVAFVFEMIGLLTGCELVFATQFDQITSKRDRLTRAADGQRRVIEFLNANPDDAKLPSRQLAARIEEVTGVSIGHDTANKGRNAWVQLRSVQVETQSNGTGE